MRTHQAMRVLPVAVLVFGSLERIAAIRCAFAQTPAPPPRVIVNPPAVGNFPRDLLGPVDPRGPDGTCNSGPRIWGNADSDNMRMVFFPPAGYRTVVTSIEGNMIGFVKALPGDPPTPPESKAEFLIGFQTSSGFVGPGPGQSPCSSPAGVALCGIGTVAFLMGVVSAAVDAVTIPIHFQGRLVLDPNNTLIVKEAEALNTLGKPVHIESAFTIGFNWELVSP